jgi:hypothetical protein
MKAGRYSGSRRAFVVACMLAAGALGMNAFAAPPADAGGAAAAPAPAKPLKPDPAFARLPRYEGTLGDRPIVVHLGPKEDESGVHGEYQFKDTGEVVLLAGDRDGDTLEVEESNDGTNITGLWVGRFDKAGGLSADRMNTDESDPQPVVLKPAGGAQSALQVRDDGVRRIAAVNDVVALRADD